MLQGENRKKTETRMTNNLVARKYLKKKKSEQYKRTYGYGTEHTKLLPDTHWSLTFAKIDLL